MARSVKPPFGLADRGRKLWADCLNQDDSLADSSNPLRDVLLNACRLADHIEVMEGILSNDGLLVSTALGDKAHPMLGELSKAMSLQTRLIVSLRMPDEATAKRPQRRPGSRTPMAQKPGGKRATVSSLERARRAAGA